MRKPDKIKLQDGTVRWRLRMRQPPGSPVAHKYVTFATKAEALAASAEHERRLRTGDVSINVDMTFEALVKQWKVSHLGKGTHLRASSLKDYEQGAAKLVAYFGKRKLTSIRIEDIEAFREHTLTTVQVAQRVKVDAIRARYTKIAADKRGVRARRMLERLDAGAEEMDARLRRIGPRATNKALGLLRMLFKFAEARRYVTFNPATHVRMVKAVECLDRPLDTNVLSVSEIGRLIDAAPSEYRAALMVLAYGGLRLGELLGLTWGDLELARNRLVVRRQRENVTGELRAPKTRAGTRFVQVPTFVANELRQHQLRTQAASPELVFPYHARRFRSEVFFPALRRAKLRRIRIHDLRHTAASVMIATGADLATISRQLGHANVAITLSTYTHWFERRSDSGLGAKVEELVRRESGCESVASATGQQANAA